MPAQADLPIPYIQHGRIFIVPVLPQRLSFAVLVWRAFRELGLDKTRDALAVSLPRSLRSHLAAAVARLDGSRGLGKRDQSRMTILLSEVRSGDYREVMPVTPCDGHIEAIRSAREHDFRVQYIDREIQPGHLAVRDCEEDPLWLDDELALLKGPAWYLGQLQGDLGRPPLRCDPVDTWREAIMAERLRALARLHARVLFVCHAAQVGPIRARLRSPADPLARSEEVDPLKIEIRAQTPHVSLRLHYLDDFPKLVEMFEQHRADGSVSRFTKRSALIEAVRELRQRDAYAPSSVRRYEAFATMVGRIATAKGRHAPLAEDVRIAANGCFEGIFALRLRRHLLEYHDEIDVDHVREGDPKAGSAAKARKAGGFAVRSCNPLGQLHFISVRAKRGKGGIHEQLGWPPCKEHSYQMRKKALALEAQEERDYPISMRYQGSIEDGVDVRRTLRTVAWEFPTLYVKRKPSPKRQPAREDDLEPVVWIFQFAPTSGLWGSTRIRDSNDPLAGYAAEWYTSPIPIETVGRIRMPEGQVDVDRGDPPGIVSFCDPRYTIADVEAVNRRSARPRVPQYHQTDPVLSELWQWANASNWIETLLEGALAFAAKRVVVVANPIFRIPERIARSARESGKGIARVPLARFTSEEIRRLVQAVRLVGPLGIEPGRDRNDPAVTADLLDRFGKSMEAYW